jgi:hypothetical protein
MSCQWFDLLPLAIFGNIADPTRKLKVCATPLFGVANLSYHRFLSDLLCDYDRLPD